MSGSRWLLVDARPLGGGRARLTFLIDGSVTRMAQVWGDPPNDTTIARTGALMVAEQDSRPIGKRYRLSNEPPPPEPPDTP
jgi:hypothetical protein